VLGVGVDFLTVTVGTDGAAGLMAISEFHEQGKPQAGFGRSEERLSVGGKCWRRWEPHQESREWGKAYECWEWSSGDARWPSQQIRGIEGVRPSRVDVAFDFAVDESLMSDAIIERCRDVLVFKGISDGISGQAGVNTRYVGSQRSERRIRIYRRDLKDGALLLDAGPIMRVELILRDDMARAWWQVWRADQARGFAAAAAHIVDMTGHRVMDADEPVPPPLVDASAEAEAAQMLFEFVKQNASVLGVVERLGVDLFGLAARCRELWPRTTWARHREREQLVADAEGTSIEERVIGLLRSRTSGEFNITANVRRA
jgi:hypothetical protein